jgi:hypothetical protein
MSVAELVAQLVEDFQIDVEAGEAAESSIDEWLDAQWFNHVDNGTFADDLAGECDFLVAMVVIKTGAHLE